MGMLAHPHLMEVKRTDVTVHMYILTLLPVLIIALSATTLLNRPDVINSLIMWALSGETGVLAGQDDSRQLK